MTSPSCDVGTSSFINVLRGRLPGRRSRAEMGPGPIGDGGGERGRDRALLAGVRVFSVIRTAHVQSGGPHHVL